MSVPEVRLERLRPHEIEAALARAPIAWIPLGALEFHADHLPNGTDGITGRGVLVEAAERLGGVVLPWSYLTIGTLALPWSFRYDPGLVADALRQTVRQLPGLGVRLAVVHTGHGPLDLNHLIKRICAEVEGEGSGLLAMGLCYLELNAVLGTGLGTDWPVAVDHGSTMETSWVGALEPTLVDTDRLPDDRDATIIGIYGPNPRFTADPERGAAQVAAAGALLAERAAARLGGERPDPLADLRTFVERYWPERLGLAGRAGGSGPARASDRFDGAPHGSAILITNPAPVSRYLAGLDLRVDGTTVDRSGMSLVNPTVGEVGEPMPVDALGPERGFYVRRLQTAELRLPIAVAPGTHDVELRLLLAGVTEAAYAETVSFE
jgi:creatinine amidohydrolase